MTRTYGDRRYFGEADIEPMLDAFGVEVVVDDQWRTVGTLDVVDETGLEGENAAFVGKLHLLTVKTGSLGPLLAEGKVIQAEGLDYKVQSVAQVGKDGALTEVALLRTS